ncbi:alpha/beta hydrolase [Kineosporia succinea]|uniref:Pimeloyl-ACP methyl ester carboxylesterase n=1 Tax=Kineosporia succinea TaxID=84632 RepID=A0ABT9P1X4_9ACTN|nr:alpha/beta hydrolase [Kineosporia succinea]MDP9826424.1 pimeloyl-ACP methyl ester carboxylesterase [Kineosporia succinea]
MQSRALRASGTGVLVGVLAAGLLLGTGGSAGADPTASKVPTVAAASRYDGQKLRWTPCLSRAELPGLPAAYYRLECATMIVPRDWNAPTSGADVRIKVSRLKSTKVKKAGMLFTNPGGPGADGADLPLLMISAQRKKLMAGQDIYGMDVRGTGGSTNLSCGGVTNLTVDPRVRTASNIDLILDSAELTAKACDVAGGALRPYVTTAQTVQDVDLLRRLAGQKTVNWLGFSAGTWMGAYYATTFPKHAGHMVFDSNVEFTGTWQTAVSRQALGFQRRFEKDFAPWVAKYHNVYGLGATPKAVLASYERLRARMTPDTPVEDAVTLDDVIAGTMYAKAMFPDAAAALSDLNGFLRAQSAGRYRTAAKLSASVKQRVAALDRDGLRPFSSDASSAVFMAVTCQDTPWTVNRDTLVASSAQLGAKNPLIGWSTLNQPCAFWKRSTTTAANLIRPTGRGVPEVLMVQSVHDPATPMEGAKEAEEHFAGARMLTVKGEGDHGLYAGGNSCVDRKVDAFILEGKLPAKDVTCLGTAMPDPGFSPMRAAGVPGSAVTNPLLALRQISELVH